MSAPAPKLPATQEDVANGHKLNGHGPLLKAFDRAWQKFRDEQIPEGEDAGWGVVAGNVPQKLGIPTYSAYNHCTFIEFFNKKNGTLKPMDTWASEYDDLVTTTANDTTPDWDMEGAKSIFCSEASIGLADPNEISEMSLEDFSRYVKEVAFKASATMTSNG